MLSSELNRNKPIFGRSVVVNQPAAPNCQPAVPVIRPGQGFYGLGIAPKILEVLERIKFKNPTPIQSKVIPQAINGADIVGIAQTGTGKTHAFAIPMIQYIA